MGGVERQGSAWGREIESYCTGQTGLVEDRTSQAAPRGWPLKSPYAQKVSEHKAPVLSSVIISVGFWWTECWKGSSDLPTPLYSCTPARRAVPWIWKTLDKMGNPAALTLSGQFLDIVVSQCSKVWIFTSRVEELSQLFSIFWVL